MQTVKHIACSRLAGMVRYCRHRSLEKLQNMAGLLAKATEKLWHVAD